MQYFLVPPPLQDAITAQGGRLTLPWERWFADLMRTFLYRWDDLRFPSGGFNPTGSTAPPNVSTATGLLEFSGVADNIIGGVAQMPHGWAPGTLVRPHLHLRFPTSAAANTRWRFDYDIASVNDNFTNVSGTYTTLATITVANPQNVKKHVVASFGDLLMVGMRESAVIIWKITRLAASDAADNDANVCELLEFDIHHQIAKFGTVPEFPS
jgi:hypothetical protein